MRLPGLQFVNAEPSRGIDLSPYSGVMHALLAPPSSGPSENLRRNA